MSEQPKKLQKRSEIPVERTWRLEDIFANDELWEEEYQALEKDITQITAYQNTLSKSADQLFNVLDLQDKLSERLGKLYTYSQMRYDQDSTNAFYQAMNARADHLLTVATSSMSFIVPEILEID